jgi:hypothetical protein
MTVDLADEQHAMSTLHQFPAHRMHVLRRGRPVALVTASMRHQLYQQVYIG